MGGQEKRDRGRAGRAGALPSTRAAGPEPATGSRPLLHGGDLDAARRRFPTAPMPWIDLSTGINPLPYAVPHLAADAWARLPTATDLGGLLAAAARRYSAPDASGIVAAPGTQALIQLLPRLVPARRVAVLGPTYDEHEASWRRQGHDVAVVADLDAARRRGAGIVVVVNPNNPTGRLLPRAELTALARELDAGDGLLVVDEAFADVLPREASLVSELPPSTVVLRSFGKTYGLAGLRLGFAVAAPATAAALRDELGPWAVSGPAIEIGTAALADDAWLAAATSRLVRDARRMDDLLAAAGCRIVGGTPLFRLAEHDDAPAIAELLGAAGIHVRVFSGERRWLRLGLPGDEAAWQRLADAMRRP